MSELDPVAAVPTRLSQALQLIRDNRLVEAEALCDELRKLLPGQAQPHWLSGLAAQRKGNSEQALPHLRRAIELDPKMTEPRMLLGWLLSERGQLEEATEQLLEARKAKPPAPDPYHLLCSNLYALGRFDELARLATESEGGQRFGEIVLAALTTWQINRLDACHALLKDAEQGRTQSAQSPNYDMYGELATLLEALLEWRDAHPEAYEGAVEQLVHVVGDAHCLPAAHLVAELDGRQRLFVPHLVVGGLKAWHLARDKESQQRAAFLATLDRIPRGETVMIACGEGDCRFTSGIGAHLRRNPGEAMEPLVDRLVAGFLDRVVEATEARGLQPILQTPPASAMVSAMLHRSDRTRFLAIANRFCTELRLGCRQRSLPLLDLNRVTLGDQGEARRQHYVDSNHLRPTAFLEACAAGLR